MTDLYRHYDKDGTLLYIGISLSSLHRLGQHRRNASWYDNISRVEIEKCADRDDALQKEKNAIKKEKPIFNIIHTTKTKAKMQYSVMGVYDCLRELGIDRGWEYDGIKQSDCFFDGVTITLRILASKLGRNTIKVKCELDKLISDGRLLMIKDSGLTSYLFNVKQKDSVRCKLYFKHGRKTMTAANIFSI